MNKKMFIFAVSLLTVAGMQAAPTRSKDVKIERKETGPDGASSSTHKEHSEELRDADGKVIGTKDTVGDEKKDTRTAASDKVVRTWSDSFTHYTWTGWNGNMKWITGGSLLAAAVAAYYFMTQPDEDDADEIIIS